MSESKRRDDRDFSAFDRMSTEMLEEILRKDFELPDQETSDMDAVLYIMRIIAERRKGEYPDAERSWETFNRSYRPKDEASGSLYESESGLDDKSGIKALKTERRRHGRFWYRLAAVAAAIVLVIGSGSLVSQATGYHLWSALARWTSEVLCFSPDTEEAARNKGAGSLNEALASYGIEEPLAPRWIPEGYVLTSVETSDLDPDIFFSAAYQKGEDCIVVAIMHRETVGSVTTYEKDDTPVELYQKGGTDHYLMSNSGQNTAAWKNGQNECSISGPISREELKKMIDSIYETQGTF